MSWRQISSTPRPASAPIVTLSEHRAPSPTPYFPSAHVAGTESARTKSSDSTRRPAAKPLTLQEYVVPTAPPGGKVDRSPPERAVTYNEHTAPRLTMQDYVVPGVPAPSNSYVTIEPHRSPPGSHIFPAPATYATQQGYATQRGQAYTTQPGVRGPVFFDDAPDDADADRTPLRGVAAQPRGPQFAEYVGVSQRVRSESGGSPASSASPASSMRVLDRCDDDWLRANPSRLPSLTPTAFAGAVLGAADALPAGVTPELVQSGVLALTGHMSGGVTEDVFMSLYRSLGPLRQMGAALCELLAAEWFYSFATGQDVERYLLEAAAEAGAFMVRFASETNLSLFIVSYVGEDGALKQVQVRSSFPQSGFSFILVDGEKRAVPTLPDAVMELARLGVLRAPLAQCLADYEWFHGCLAADAATNVLNHCLPGTYLFRFSGQKGAYAVSEVTEDRGMRTVAHTRLVTGADGWLSDPVTQKRWRSLESFVSLASLKYPHVSMVGAARDVGKKLREARRASAETP